MYVDHRNNKNSSKKDRIQKGIQAPAVMMSSCFAACPVVKIKKENQHKKRKKAKKRQKKRSSESIIQYWAFVTQDGALDTCVSILLC